MFTSPFPSIVAFRVVTADLLGDFELFPDEAAALSPQAIAKRRLHFRLGRAAARGAIEQLGVEPQPIPRAEDGRPLWPAGLVGAITHTEDLGAADPSGEADVALRRATLRAALGELNGRERELVALKFFAGLDNSEIAGVLGISESNAGTKLHRTIEKLRRACDDAA